MIGALIIGMRWASFFWQICVVWFGKLLLSVSVRGLSLPVFLTWPESEARKMVQWV